MTDLSRCVVRCLMWSIQPPLYSLHKLCAWRFFCLCLVCSSYRLSSWQTGGQQQLLSSPATMCGHAIAHQTHKVMQEGMFWDCSRVSNLKSESRLSLWSFEGDLNAPRVQVANSSPPSLVEGKLLMYDTAHNKVCGSSPVTRSWCLRG